MSAFMTHGGKIQICYHLKNLEFMDTDFTQVDFIST